MKRRARLPEVILTILVAVMSSCTFGGRSKELTIADITSATSLVVGDANLGKSASAGILLKWTTTGQLETVEMIDETGSQTIAVPNGIHTVGDYVVLVFPEGEFAHDTYLVRKSDGAAFALNGLLTSTTNGKSVYVDSASRVYYLSAGRVWRVDTLSMIEESVTPSVDDVSCFAADSNGNVLYKYYQTSTAGARVSRVSGGLANLSYFPRLIFAGLDGNIYCQDDTSDRLIIKRVVIAPDGSLTFESYGSPSASAFVYYDYQFEWLYFGDRIIAICDNSFELWNGSGTPRYIPVSVFNFNNRKLTTATNSFYFVSTKNSGLVRINPSNDNTLTIFDGDYDIYAMGALANDSILFHGLSLDSSTLVTGTVDSSGVIQIQTEIGDSQILSIVRIN